MLTQFFSQGSVQRKYLPLDIHNNSAFCTVLKELRVNNAGEKNRLWQSLLSYAEALVKFVERCLAPRTENVF
jgi:hypothetical protein